MIKIRTVKNIINFILLTVLYMLLINAAYPLNCLGYKNNIMIFRPDTSENTSPDTVRAVEKKIIYIYDTVKVERILYKYDTVVIYDTVNIYFPEEQYSKWLAELSFSPVFNENILTSNQPQYSEYVETKSRSEKPQVSYSFEANLGYYLNNNLFIRSGMAYTYFRDKVSFNTTNILVDSTSYYDLTYGYWDIDTVDSYYVVHGYDTTWHYITHEDWIDHLDSSLITEYDTTTDVLTHNHINQYYYIEIPLILGYELSNNRSGFAGRISCSFSGGIIAGFFVNAKGKTIALDDKNELVDLNDLPYIKPNFSFLFALGINYNIIDSLKLTARPYFRQNICSVFNKEYPVALKNYSAGVKVGMEYRF